MAVGSVVVDEADMKLETVPYLLSVLRSWEKTDPVEQDMIDEACDKLTGEDLDAVPHLESIVHSKEMHLEAREVALYGIACILGINSNTYQNLNSLLQPERSLVLRLLNKSSEKIQRFFEEK